MGHYETEFDNGMAVIWLCHGIPLREEDSVNRSIQGGPRSRSSRILELTSTARESVPRWKRWPDPLNCTKVLWHCAAILRYARSLDTSLDPKPRGALQDASRSSSCSRWPTC
jgi:hypothetical protein